MTDPARYDQALADVFGGVPSTGADSALLAEWVEAARRKWGDYQRVLIEAPDNHIAAGVRERSLVEMVPHLIAAHDGLWVQFETWLKARRDAWGMADDPYDVLDDALDDLREHMHTGTPLDRPVQGPHHEGA